MSLTFDFQGKVIALTGGASGIGLETAKLLVASGAKVSIADVQQEALKQAVSTIENNGGPGEVISTVVDVTNAKQVKDWIKQTVSKWGKLDGAANLAGVIGAGMNKNRLEEQDDEDWAFVVGVNLTGVMYCMREEINNINYEGSIVNASSIAGIRGTALNSPYVASKHGVAGLTKAAAKEVGDRGIRVNAIAPGVIDTPMSRKASEIRGKDMAFQNAIKRKGLATEVADLVAWLLCDRSKFISGTVQSIDGAWASSV